MLFDRSASTHFAISPAPLTTFHPATLSSGIMHSTRLLLALVVFVCLSSFQTLSVRAEDATANSRHFTETEELSERNSDGAADDDRLRRLIAFQNVRARSTKPNSVRRKLRPCRVLRLN